MLRVRLGEQRLQRGDITGIDRRHVAIEQRRIRLNALGRAAELIGADFPRQQRRSRDRGGHQQRTTIEHVLLPRP